MRSGKGYGFRSLGVEWIRKLEKGIETQLEWRKMKSTGPGDMGTNKFKRIGERVKV